MLMNVSTISTTVNVIKVPYIVPSHVRVEIVGTLAVASSLMIQFMDLWKVELDCRPSRFST